MSNCRPLSDRNLRGLVRSIALAGVTTTGAYTLAAVLAPAGPPGWVAAVGIGLLYPFAVFVAITGYRFGYLAREREATGHEVGRWLAYPVDEDGVPTMVPVTGRLVLDDPVETKQ